jgi:hypothetical protein
LYFQFCGFFEDNFNFGIIFDQSKDMTPHFVTRTIVFILLLITTTKAYDNMNYQYITPNNGAVQQVSFSWPFSMKAVDTGNTWIGNSNFDPILLFYHVFFLFF